MKVISHRRYGPPDVLEYTSAATPVARPGEVLVRVRAASVNARDWHLLRGDPYLARLSVGVRSPRERVRGTDFAGVVEAVGPGVDDLRQGDEVFGEAPGAFAEHVVAARDVVAVKPSTLTFAEAAALPLAANTALMGLREAAAVRPGQSVLINGASGGVGLFAVQLAVADGADVTAVCSARNADAVRALGAQTVVDYTKEDVTRAGRRFDVVFDLVGNHSLRSLLRVTSPRGVLVLSGGGVSRGGSSAGGSVFGPVALIARGKAAAGFVRPRVVVLTAEPSRARLATLRELAEAGTLRPIIDRTFPLSAAADAIRYLETDHARAKVVLTVEG